MNLTALANKFGSDKGTVAGGPPHKYTFIYDLIFYPLRNQGINFLEMGLAVGGPELGGPIDRKVMSPSIQMWLDYFPKAMIYGFDISDFSHMIHPRFIFTRGDSGSEDDLKRLASTALSFDVIVDDASHASYHQQLAFKCLWPQLSSGGLYVIENLQWQSPAFETILPATRRSSDVFSSYFERGEYLENPVLSNELLASVAEEVYSYSLFHALDGKASLPKQLILRKR